MKGLSPSFMLRGAAAQCLFLFHGIAIAYGSSSTALEVSAVVLPEPAPAIVRTLNANKEVVATYEIHPGTAMEKVHVMSMMEEAKGDASSIKIISVTFN